MILFLVLCVLITYINLNPKEKHNLLYGVPTKINSICGYIIILLAMELIVELIMVTIW